MIHLDIKRAESPKDLMRCRCITKGKGFTFLIYKIVFVIIKQLRHGYFLGVIEHLTFGPPPNLLRA